MLDSKFVNSYIHKTDVELTIENFDKLVLELEDKNKFEEIKNIGKILSEAHAASVNMYIKKLWITSLK